MNIQMVDLKGQYHKIQQEIDRSVLETLRSTAYINGPKVHSFRLNLEQYLQVANVIPCANGTDALQVALMALGLKAGDEVIVPAFTYVATAEVIALLGLTPIMVDVELDTFNVSAKQIEAAITPKTKAIVPVHLYGQCCDMEPILALAKEHNIAIIEDSAQAIGATYTFANGDTVSAGTMGDIGCTSFYPSKNLGCYGDGGAIYTNDEDLALLLKKIANHGQEKRYYHDIVGVNSRLDSVQAAILDVKLRYLDTYNEGRLVAAAFYDSVFAEIEEIQIPKRQANSTHVFHQYTLRVPASKRDALKDYLTEKGIPSVIYYPVPLYRQGAFKSFVDSNMYLPNTEELCQTVISLPMHSELDQEQLSYICDKVKAFFD